MPCTTSCTADFSVDLLCFCLFCFLCSFFLIFMKLTLHDEKEEIVVSAGCVFFELKVSLYLDYNGHLAHRKGL